jgi:serine/threonine-protein kinase Chk1
MLTINPQKRITLDDALSHPWMMRYVPDVWSTLHTLISFFPFRPSQLASQSVATLADKLTESLRHTGDLELANPSLQK